MAEKLCEMAGNSGGGLEPCKQLWTGNFTSGSITVIGGAKYHFIGMQVGDVFCTGNYNYGIGGYLAYGELTVETAAYRFAKAQSGDDIVLTIDSFNRGGAYGGTQRAITSIVGIA